MTRQTMRMAAVAAALVLGACNTPAGGGTRSQPAGGTSSQAAGGGGGSRADAATLNPCNILSASDIQAAIGWSVDAGKLQTSTGQSDCEWADPSDDSHSVGLTIANFDETLWQAGASSSNAKTVSGLGDAAYEGWPTANALSIKVKGYEVTIGVINFAQSNDKIHTADQALAKLVLPKL